jgi:hypothetical protein
VGEPNCPGSFPVFVKGKSMKRFKQSIKYGSGLALATLAASVFAQAAPSTGIDLSAITNSFKASDVIVAVLAVAAALAAIYATMTAAKMALRWIRGG